ncbi:RimK family alpha-L-glutamate ligase [Oceaniglobus roseus]|uniref:RimK family alpha-L-glutamate ligase n=1 Tax=Oceaniglobus roseus TaxID=1737570 RepID=UPI000C7E887C|nr:RimK family alpha-L-glutamate ligase [Kandeliimicrobium roseum]
MSDSPASPFRLGWEEWCALPALGLPAIRAKVDTGARTSALHAFDIEPFGPAAKPKVRFAVHPIPGRHDLTIACSALIHDRREVTSSNGETEFRYVIQSEIAMGGRSWPVELTLTDRGSMAYRMLLGRQGIAPDMVVAPSERLCQPELSFDVYSSAKVRATAPRRSLRLAILSREAKSYTARRLVEEAESRGHTVEVIDTTRCYMAINAIQPEVHYDGKRLPRYDAVIPRIGPALTPYGTAVIRQFETIGTHSVNGSEGIMASRDRIFAQQVLARYHIGMPATAFAASPKDTANLIGLVGKAPLLVKLLDTGQGGPSVLAESRAAADSVIAAFRGLRANFLVQDYLKDATESIRCLVIANKVAASIRRPLPGSEKPLETIRLRRSEREAALRAARAFKLGFATVDLLRTAEGPKVLDLNATPGLEALETASGRNLAAPLVDAIEKRVRPAPVRKGRAAATES